MRARLFAGIFVAASALAACAVRGVEVEGLPHTAAPRPVKFVEPREKTLGNGLRVIVVERTGLPLVSADVLIKDGSEADPPQLSGLAGFTAALLTQGTETRNATQIAREVESLGATLKATATWDGTGVALTTLAGQLEPAFVLLADVTRHPKFVPEEIERLRKQRLDELRLSLEEPGTVASLAASRVILGRGPYAHPASGTVASIKRLRREQIAGFHAARYVASQAQIIIVGNVTAEAAFTIAEQNFGDWKSAENAVPAPARFEPAATSRAVLIDMPNAGQAAVIVGGPCIARNAEDYFAGLVTNAVLGGGYTSRLNQEIRVKRGLSYGAASTLTALRAGGTCTARCQTKNVSAPEVITLMRTELKRLADEPVPADYLATRQAMLAGDFARELETNTGYVTRIADFARHDVPLDSISHYVEKINRVTAEDVRTFAAKHLAPETMSVVVAGRAKDCAKPLRALFPALEQIPQSALDLDSPKLRPPAKH